MKREQGTVLATALFILLAMTLVTISGFRSIVTEEKMVSNTTNMFYATQSANSAVREGENWLLNQVEVPISCNNACTVWSSTTLPDTTTASDDWWQSNGTTLTETIANVTSQPRYVMEEILFIPDDLSPESWASGVGIYYYSITGRSYGGNDIVERQIQSIYTTRYY